MLDPTAEIARLKDLLPASWRMTTSIKSSLEPQSVIFSSNPQLWRNNLKVFINFSLWSELPSVERDLLLLREVSLRQHSRWLKLGAYQAISVLSLVGAIVQFNQADLAGAGMALVLTTVSGVQVWRKAQGLPIQLQADLDAISAAERRGYTEMTAAKALLAAIANVAKIENRNTPTFAELIRCQQLRSIAGISNVPIPSGVDLP